MQIEIKIDDAQFRELERTLAGVRDGARRAIVPALNRGAAHARTLISREIRAELNITQKETLRAVSLVNANPTRLAAKVTVSRQPRPLIAYGAKQTKRGVRVMVRRRAGYEVLPHAFIATMKSGHVGVFERVGGSRHREVPGKRKKWVQGAELPIRQLYGPTVVGVLANNPAMLDRVVEAANRTVAERISSQVDRLLAGK